MSNVLQYQNEIFYIEEMVVGLDLSTTETGYSLYSRSSKAFVEAGVLKSTTAQVNDRVSEMTLKVNELLKRLSDELKNECRGLVVVIENYTDTLTCNDRSGIAKDIIKMCSEVESFIGTLNNVVIAKALPWSWRKVFNLPTKVQCSESIRWDKVAKTLGHDILKNKSLDFVESKRDTDTMSNLVNITLDDNIAEAILIAMSFILTNKLVQDESYYNPLELIPQDVIQEAIKWERQRLNHD